MAAFPGGDRASCDGEIGKHGDGFDRRGTRLQGDDFEAKPRECALKPEARIPLEIVGRVMHRVKEGDAEQQPPSLGEHAMKLAECGVRLGQMLEHVESRDRREALVREGQTAGIGEDIGAGS